MDKLGVQVLAGVFSVLYLAYIVWKLRQQKLSVSHSLLWLLSGLAMLFLSIFPEPLAVVAKAAGFEVPANAVFILWLLILTALLFSQTMALSRVDDRLKRLAQDQAMSRASGRDGDEAG